jgi:hypothetical protein
MNPALSPEQILVFFCFLLLGLSIKVNSNKGQEMRVQWAGISQYSDSLHAGQAADRVPVGGDIFPISPNRSWGPPSLLYNGYWFSFQRVKRPRRDLNHQPTSSAEVKESVELYLYSPSGPSWPVLWRNSRFTFTFTTTCNIVLKHFHKTTTTRLWWYTVILHIMQLPSQRQANTFSWLFH